MKHAIILGIAIGYIVYEIGIVIPWIISNKILSIEIDILLFMGNLLTVIYIVHKLVKFYYKKYNPNKKRKSKVHGEAQYINKLKNQIDKSMR